MHIYMVFGIYACNEEAFVVGTLSGLSVSLSLSRGSVTRSLRNEKGV